VVAYHSDDWLQQGRLVQRAKEKAHLLIPTGEKWDRQKAIALLDAACRQ